MSLTKSSEHEGGYREREREREREKERNIKKSNTSLGNRLLMVSGSWLMAHGSRMAGDPAGPPAILET